MVKFVDVDNMARWIQREGVEKIITGMVSYLEKDYSEWERFDLIPRVASHTPFGVIELMPTSNGEEYPSSTSTVTHQTQHVASKPLPHTACLPTSTTATQHSCQK